MLTTRFLHVLLFSSLALAWVDLDPAIIPAVDEPLEVYSLGSPSFLPHEWLDGIVGNVAEGVKFAKRGDDSSKIYAYNGDEVVGFVDKNTGETQVYTDYDKIPAAKNPIDIKNALKIFEHGKDGFPADDTHVELVQGASLVGSTMNNITDDESLSRRWNYEEPDATFLTTGYFQRWVKCKGKKFPVCGPGSRASFGVGVDNRIFSLSYRWKPAKNSGRKVKPSPLSTIEQVIRRWLEGKGRIKIKHIDICYYDSGAQWIQPVYRVLGEGFPEDNHDNGTDSSEVLRFFPIGDEPVENVFPEGAAAASEGQPWPAEPKENQPTEVARSLKRNYFEARNSLYERFVKPTVTVGRYVTQNDIHQTAFLTNANGFWNNLAPSSLVNFVNSQYFWAPRWIYGSSAQSFVNSVNLALTEAHGWKHLFSTWQGSPFIDPVRIPSTLPPAGYGPGPNKLGRLAYWIIDASKVIAAPTDFPGDPRQAFKPWWRVLCGGLHAVLGWRTNTVFGDNVAIDTAWLIANFKVPVVSAWLHTAYWAYLGWPFPGHPYGRASVIYPCGRGSDKIWQVEKLPKPTCLKMKWWV
ncbi:hypothetical protein H1R20_g2017, partial [Candolleomyces eurysporus]